MTADAGWVDAAAELLLAAQNGDGGWGAERGRSTTTEATAFAVLAASRVPRAVAHQAADRGLEWLRAHQNVDGSWPVGERVPGASWTTSLAVLALEALGSDPDRAERGIAWLGGDEPRRYRWLDGLMYRFAPDSLPVRLDPTLQGWSWALGTASWVEPTAYALLAIDKHARRTGTGRLAERVRQAEAMLRDRMCEGGGWNYGNSRVYGTALAPYADTTALTLLALHVRPASGATLASLDALETLLDHVRSGLALGWATLCFAAYRRDTGRSLAALGDTFARTRCLGQVKSLALAVLAAGGAAGIFTV